MESRGLLDVIACGPLRTLGLTGAEPDQIRRWTDQDYVNGYYFIRSWIGGRGNRNFGGRKQRYG